ncbi:DUF924 family protein [Actibacterium sp. XHP0104]|uniref:DUF924 family protein n=1 Tax=Actibacterium sp. XHP0104 TaxID=2984335 RepID=UPI0021E8C30C|nr:DUF924 family protein [Actibacterium sp. XHP0104]MCV2880824.1 DUF924 domain-containing protein [Actibacterium sp. XHP0104]
MTTAQEVRDFWLGEVGPEGWYAGGDELDARIRDRFEDLWLQARKGGLHDWLANPADTLSYLLLTDQFPRNMFRGDAQAFATDAMARTAAKNAIAKEFDMRIPTPERQFFYLPLMHSETMTDQDRCVRLMMLSMPGDDGENLLHARAHREIIRRFGRFPYRNAALSRETSPAEQDFLDKGGYAKIVARLKG